MKIRHAILQNHLQIEKVKQRLAKTPHRKDFLEMLLEWYEGDRSLLVMKVGSPEKYELHLARMRRKFKI
jgi:hypothetical protein